MSGSSSARTRGGTGTRSVLPPLRRKTMTQCPASAATEPTVSATSSPTRTAQTASSAAAAASTGWQSAIASAAFPVPVNIRG